MSARHGVRNKDLSVYTCRSVRGRSLPDEKGFADKRQADSGAATGLEVCGWLCSVCVYSLRGVTFHHATCARGLVMIRACRLKEHLESNRKTCNSTGTLNGAGVNFNVLAYCVTCDVWIASVISLLPTLKDALHAQLNAEAITAELRTRLVVVVKWSLAHSPSVFVFASLH